ncbi:nucleotidyltransferase-like protein [Paenibacillus sp.]|uniref:nucleotidyltransferase-like protein n=1 Tax=Paenibacillus sp. TaxID=58172 RepID=UPI002D6A5626|nr:nucleotidyltransferase-like protein [Paenibacillus sp.]HZG86524.1 nucleotidyltransferase-like protein [Paenibacillus sp.]
MIKSIVERFYMHRPDIIGAAFIEKPMQFSALIDGFDALIIVVTDGDRRLSYTHHYSKDQTYIQERWYDRTTLEALLGPGGNRDVQQWLMTGEIVLDREGFLQEKREMLLSVAPDKREQRLFKEFALFLRHFLLSRNFLEEGEVLDAHSHILQAVHHWAKISVIESGVVPELTVWKQVRKANPGIFKLYEELTMSNETLEQRIRLAHLACDFSVMSKLKDCCQPLLRILSSRSEPWSATELENHPDLRTMQTELHLLLKKLVRRKLIQEVFVASDANLDMLEMRYIS